MSWLTALKIVFDFKSAYDEIDQVKKYSKKLENKDPKKLKWDDLKYFSNKTMDKAKKAIKQTLKKTKAAEKTFLDWPESLTQRAFSIYFKEFMKSGKDDAKTRNALKMYQITLKVYDQDLTKLVAKLKEAEKKIAQNQRRFDALVKYADLLQKVFMQCAKIPSLTGTAQNAMFFGLSRDAQDYGSTARDVSKSIGRLAKLNAEYVREVKDKIRINRLWMKWAGGSKATQEQSLKKSASAKTPK